MARKKNHTNNQRPMEWPDVWRRIQSNAKRLGASDDIQDALSESTSWRVAGEVMYIHIPERLCDYIELHMDEFKPILWPFLLSHHCNKLIYE